MGRPCRCCGVDLECDVCNCWNGRSENYDWALLICNVNGATDDDFEIALNGHTLGKITELGVDQCTGKFFTTNTKMVDYIKAEAAKETDNDWCFIDLCCIEDATVKEVDKEVFTYCVGGTDTFKSRTAQTVGFVITGRIDVPCSTLCMTNIKKNYNNNYGAIRLWRKKKKDICLVATTSYSGRTGQDIVRPLTQTCCISLPARPGRTGTSAKGVPTLDMISDLSIDETQPDKGGETSKRTNYRRKLATQTVDLSGITVGSDVSFETLNVTATSSNTGLIPHPIVTYTSANATGTLQFTPVDNENGMVTITVTVEASGGDDTSDDDNGGNGGTSGGSATLNRTFDVFVKPGPPKCCPRISFPPTPFINCPSVIPQCWDETIDDAQGYGHTIYGKRKWPIAAYQVTAESCAVYENGFTAIIPQTSCSDFTGRLYKIYKDEAPLFFDEGQQTRLDIFSTYPQQYHPSVSWTYPFEVMVDGQVRSVNKEDISWGPMEPFQQRADHLTLRPGQSFPDEGACDKGPNNQTGSYSGDFEGIAIPDDGYTGFIDPPITKTIVAIQDDLHRFIYGPGGFMNGWGWGPTDVNRNIQIAKSRLTDAQIAVWDSYGGWLGGGRGGKQRNRPRGINLYADESDIWESVGYYDQVRLTGLVGLYGGASVGTLRGGVVAHTLEGIGFHLSGHGMIDMLRRQTRSQNGVVADSEYGFPHPTAERWWNVDMDGTADGVEVKGAIVPFCSDGYVIRQNVRDLWAKTNGNVWSTFHADPVADFPDDFVYSIPNKEARANMPPAQGSVVLGYKSSYFDPIAVPDSIKNNRTWVSYSTTYDYLHLSLLNPHPPNTRAYTKNLKPGDKGYKEVAFYGNNFGYHGFDTETYPEFTLTVWVHNIDPLSITDTPFGREHHVYKDAWTIQRLCYYTTTKKDWKCNDFTLELTDIKSANRYGLPPNVTSKEVDDMVRSKVPQELTFARIDLDYSNDEFAL